MEENCVELILFGDSGDFVLTSILQIIALCWLFNFKYAAKYQVKSLKYGPTGNLTSKNTWSELHLTLSTLSLKVAPHLNLSTALVALLKFVWLSVEFLASFFWLAALIHARVTSQLPRPLRNAKAVNFTLQDNTHLGNQWWISCNLLIDVVSTKKWPLIPAVAVSKSGISFYRIWWINISIDSSFSALSKFFWDQFDGFTRSVSKVPTKCGQWKTTLSEKGNRLQLKITRFILIQFKV